MRIIILLLILLCVAAPQLKERIDFDAEAIAKSNFVLIETEKGINPTDFDGIYHKIETLGFKMVRLNISNGYIIWEPKGHPNPEIIKTLNKMKGVKHITGCEGEPFLDK